MAVELDIAYSHCQRVTKENARNFYYTFRPLPVEKRRAIYAVYAYCRLCDDIADGDLPIEDKYRGFAKIRQSLRGAEPSNEHELMYYALRDTAQKFQIPYQRFEEILQGVEMDMIKSRFADFDELREYCYKVASVVGLVCIRIFGYEHGYEHPKAKDYAIDMGIAMQLTNILRDVKEDAERGRIYIPQDEMAQFGYTETELKQGAMTDGFRELMSYQTARARSYFDSSKRLFPLISADARTCPKLMHATYSGILDRIERAGFNVFERRIGLSAGAKMQLLARLGLTGVLSSLTMRHNRR